jgi:hypothetical protein
MSRAKLSFPVIAIACCLGYLLNCQKNPVNNTYTPPPGSTSNGFFTVIQPVSGTYTMGAYDTITWATSLPATSYVQVYLYNDQQLAYTYSTSTLNDGIIYWYFPTGLASGTKYHIKIQNAADTTQWDFGGYFTLTSGYSGTFSIQNPVDTSVWQAGSTFSIQWQYTGSPGSYVALQLYNDSVYSSSITTLTYTSNGYYSWTIPSTIASGSNYRIKISSYYDAGLYAFSDKFTIAGLDPDSYEFDNVRDSAKTAASGIVQQHTITYSDTDWVMFTADSGKTYILQDSGQGSFRTYLYVYYGSETSYRTYSYTNTYGYLKWFWSCTQSGTYYLKIYPYYSGYTGSYSFKMTSVDPGSVATFTAPTSSTSWTAGSSNTLSWIPDTGVFGSYVNLYLYKGNQLVYTIYTYLNNSGSYTFTIPSGLATGSDYRIRLANYSYSQVYGYSQNFTISGMAPDAYEFDDIRDSAKTLALDSLQQHNITYHDTDWVKFTADSGSSYVVQSNDSTTGLYFYFYFGTETTLNNSMYTYSNGRFMGQWSCTRTGTYSLKIFPYYSGYTGKYTLKITKIDSLTSAKFTSPTAGTPWASGSTYTVNWTPDTGLFGNYVNLALYKSNQLISTIYTYLNNSGSYSWAIPGGLLTGSDYRLRLENYSYSTTIYGYSQAFTISGVSPDAYEFDNIRDSAKTAVSGVNQQHNITPNDTDWVRFTADSGKVYVIQDSSGSTFYNYLYLYYGTETSYRTYNYNYSTGYLKWIWSCTQSGTYYLRITRYSATYPAGSYSLKVTEVNPLTSASFTNPTSASAWSAGSSYPISWTPDTGIFSSYVNLYLYKGNQRVYTFFTYGSNTGSYTAAIPAGLASGSNYSIRLANYSYSTTIYGNSDTFSISGVAPDVYEYDDSANDAKTITTDGTPQARSLSYGDYDWISFTAEKDSLYVIQASGGSTVYMYLFLYSNPAGSYLSYNYGYTPKLLWTCPASGTYYLRIYPYSTSYYGNYSVYVKRYSLMSSVTFLNPTSASAWTMGSPYSIQWIADTALFSAHVNIQLSVDTTVFYTIATYVTNTTGTSTYSWTPPTGIATGSQYRIKLSNYTYANITGFSDTFAISGIASDASEPDNTAATAHAIATNGVAEGHTLTLGDKDWYRFSATANLLYLIQSHGSLRPALYLYNTDGATLLTSANTGYTDTSATVVWFCPASGTYYFRDTAISTYGYGSYQTSVSGYDSAAYALSVSAPAAGDTLTTGLSYSVQWSSAVSVGGYVDIFLYDSAGIVSTVVANVANSGSYSWTVPGATTPGATYYVRVISRYNPNINGNSGVFTIQ